MTLDNALDQLGAVRRDVETRDHEGRPARVLVAEQTYPTSAADLWDALTNPERLPRWFLPVTGELRLGGRYQLEGNAGGTITRCAKPHEFAATWEYGDTTSWITVRLTPVDDGHTRFELEHAGVDDPDFWAQYGPGAAGLGWDMGLMGLALHVPHPDRPVDKDAVAAFMASPDGVEFLRRSSEAWCTAHLESGADPETARGMADRSFAAYTGG
jgi:uncharacterized protein YndB with AHSA1/START domain